MMRVCIVIVMAFWVSGCAGLVLERFENRTATLESPKLAEQKGKVWGSGNEQYNKTDIVALWGEPDNKRTTDNNEQWVYQFAKAKKGFFALVLIVPLPLTYDDGFEQITLNFDDDILQSVQFRYHYQKSSGCMVVMLIHGGSNTVCGSEHGEKIIDGVPEAFYPARVNDPQKTPQ